MGVTAMRRRVSEGEPFGRMELAYIDPQGLSAVRPHDIPERDVDMPGGEADRRRACDHKRRFDRVLGCDAQLFLQLPDDGRPRVLARLDVAPGRQPKLRVPVVHQEDMPGIDDGEIRHQVLGRRCGLRKAEQSGARVDPRQRIGTVVILQGVHWNDGEEFVAYACAQGVGVGRQCSTPVPLLPPR